MSADTGQDIESLCSKCGDVWHVVVAKVGDKIAKVQCKECGAYHRYRSPKGAKTKAKAATRRKSSSRKSAAKQEVSTRFSEPQVKPDMSRPPRPYDFRADDYKPGDRIEHPKFGTGVIEMTSEPGKMQVFFPEGRRVLARAKPKSTLTRPKPFEHSSSAEPD